MASGDPVLRNWRAIAGCLVGEVQGHPSIDDGWMFTSEVRKWGDGWARTTTRRYLLEAPWPDGEPTPPKAAKPIASRILANMGTVGGIESAAEALAAAEQLAAEALSGKQPGARRNDE